MTVPTPIIVFLAAAGCVQHSITTPLPSADTDSIGGKGPALVSTHLHPCGYDLTYDQSESGTVVDHEHYVASITYNAAGLDAVENAVDDHGGFAFRDATDYDAIGNQLHFKDESAGSPTFEAWLVYDPSGPLVRYSGDEDGDGHEDWVAIYTYGDDGKRLTAHLTGKQNYDRAYHYDVDGRLLELDKDKAFDGVIDEVTRFEYDDPNRVIRRTVTDITGAVIDSGTTTFDADDHVISDQRRPIFDGGYDIFTDDSTYDAGRLVREVYGTVVVTTADNAMTEEISRYDWHYGQCP